MADNELIRLREEVERLKAAVASLSSDLRSERGRTQGARVAIDNLEGAFKVLGTAPGSSDTNYKNGSLVLSDSGGTRKVHVRVNGAWYSVTVT